MGFLDKIFGSHSERELKRLEKTVKAVMDLEEELGVELELEEKVSTVGELVDFVESKVE